MELNVTSWSIISQTHMFHTWTPHIWSYRAGATWALRTPQQKSCATELWSLQCHLSSTINKHVTIKYNTQRLPFTATSGMAAFTTQKVFIHLALNDSCSAQDSYTRDAKQYRKNAIWCSRISMPNVVCFGRQSVFVCVCHQTIKLQDWHYPASIRWCIHQLWLLSVSACYYSHGLVEESSSSFTSSTATLFFFVAMKQLVNIQVLLQTCRTQLQEYIACLWLFIDIKMYLIHVSSDFIWFKR